MNLSESAFAKLNKHFSEIKEKSKSPKIWTINDFHCNVRTASRKSRDKFWFDVTPSLYEKNEINFFIYVCGSSEIIYIFPVLIFRKLIKGAHLGGQKQVPNFTIFDDTSEFEPAGLSHARHDIAQYKNAFNLIT